MRERAAELGGTLEVTTAPGEAGPAQDLLVERLEAANYPVSSVAIEERGERAVERGMDGGKGHRKPGTTDKGGRRNDRARPRSDLRPGE